MLNVGRRHDILPLAYQGCDEGYPVTWCEWDGDHNRAPFGNTAVATFFKQF